MKKIWFFGDSFTEATQVQNNTTFSNTLGKHGEQWWKIVSRELDGAPMLIAKGGSSTQRIFMKAFHHYTKVQAGDWVFITNSVITRTEGPDFYENKITTYNNEHFLDLELADDNKDNIINNLTQKDLPIENDSNYGVPIPLDKSELLVNYVYDFILSWEDVWERYWIDNLLQLQRMFQSKGVNCFLWTKDLWNKFSSIYDETNGKLTDDHWGIKGNQDFATFVLENIKKENYTILPTKNSKED